MNDFQTRILVETYELRVSQVRPNIDIAVLKVYQARGCGNL